MLCHNVVLLPHPLSVIRKGRSNKGNDGIDMLQNDAMKYFFIVLVSDINNIYDKAVDLILTTNEESFCLPTVCIKYRVVNKERQYILVVRQEYKEGSSVIVKFVLVLVSVTWKYALVCKSYCSTVHFRRITSFYEPTNAHIIYDPRVATASQHIPTQHDMLPQHLVCKYELNCEYCNITLARNKAP